MIRSRLGAAFAGLLLLGHVALADSAPAGGGLMSKEAKGPVAIEADSLEVFDKEQKAIYSGNVVVTQGGTVMKAGRMTVFYDRAPAATKASNTAAPAAAETPDSGEASVRKVEAEGSVVISDRDQIATGEHGLYDAVADTVTLTGHVALTKGKNVTKGERLVYNLATGIATVDAGANGRVSSTFVPSEKTKSGAAPKP